MKLGMFAGSICRICGSDTLGADIGCGCRIMYEKAKFIALKKHNGDSLVYNWIIKTSHYMELFCTDYVESYKKHKGDTSKMFRTEFNRSFFPSIYKQWNEKKRISAKQFSIVFRRIEATHDVSLIEKEIEKEKASFLADFTSKNDSEIVEIARNLWKVKKEK